MADWHRRSGPTTTAPSSRVRSRRSRTTCARHGYYGSISYSEPVTRWLEDPKRKRWHLLFTPTSASWVNLIENWFAQLTKKRLLNSAFTSVAELVDAIEEWTSHWNDDPHPFMWTKPANDIITKVRRGRATLTHQTNSATDH
ncbi:MAG: hypothetical protein GY925_27925 [Actinomycetia bacterium]|nr:hypothetical protein [Actinomycetes bacterium]